MIMVEGFASEDAALENNTIKRCTFLFDVADVVVVRLHPTRLELISFIRIELKGDVNYVDIYNKREANRQILEHLYEMGNN